MSCSVGRDLSLLAAEIKKNKTQRNAFMRHWKDMQAVLTQPPAFRCRRRRATVKPKECDAFSYYTPWFCRQRCPRPAASHPLYLLLRPPLLFSGILAACNISKQLCFSLPRLISFCRFILLFQRKRRLRVECAPITANKRMHRQTTQLTVNIAGLDSEFHIFVYRNRFLSLGSPCYRSAYCKQLAKQASKPQLQLPLK